MTDCRPTAVLTTPALAEAIAGISGAVGVGVSGGRDSMALLHAAVQYGRQMGVAIHALHVHHGLMPQAQAWVEFLQNQCQQWGVPLAVHYLQGKPAAAQSIEEWARDGRYQALRTMALERHCGGILLAHHQADLAETFLLQALRGAGPRGLAAMPERALRHGLLWLRPWLHSCRTEIDQYCQTFDIPYIEDPSNTDTRFARNRLRHEVVPALMQQFPQAQGALARSAQACASAQAALAELAQMDRAACLSPDQDTEQGALAVPALLALSRARLYNLLSHWLRDGLPQRWPSGLLDELMGRLRLGACFRLPIVLGYELRCYRDVLTLQVVVSSLPPLVDAIAEADAIFTVRGYGCYPCAQSGGYWWVRPPQPDELALPCLESVLLEQGLQWAVRRRLGTDRFAKAPRSAARSLKKAYQEAGVPQWERSGPYLADAQGRLLYAPALGLNAQWAQIAKFIQAPQIGLAIEWLKNGEKRDKDAL
jgi:tRNA(Ile)-lysidine synthase